MDLDERLERLKQRQEALLKMVKSLAGERLEPNSTQNLRTLTQDIAEGTTRLLHIAQIHENSITGLEGGE